MDFISNKKQQIEEMLNVIGVASIEELFHAIPTHLLHKRPLEDDGLSEYEGLQHLQALAKRNTFSGLESYLGAGAYEHHVPALVQAVCSKSQFLTSYTPYQAEASQGMLQAIFEYQSIICALTGMDVANASVYDGASACAESILLCLRINKGRQKILVAETLHPHYRGVVDQYLASLSVQVVTVPMGIEGGIDFAFLEKEMDENTACLLIQSPNFLGCMEETSRCTELAKKLGVLSILCANPLSYGLYASAAECGCDIAAGECQPLGLALNFGGPYAGYMACREALMRQMPGRMVGETVDCEGKRAFVLTLQAREQHIRREKATSNICTNQALAALAVLVGTLWYGKKGLPKLALTNFQRAMYLKDQVGSLPGISHFSSLPMFNEFVIRIPKPPSEVLRYFREHGIEPGLYLGDYFPALSHHFLVAVTETKNKEQLDRYCQLLAIFLGEK